MPDATDHPTPPPAPGTLFDRLDPARFTAFLLRRRTRYALAWAAALLGGAIALAHAWTWCNKPARRDGNWGHTSIDFGGQWAGARMVALGRGRHLYHLNRLRPVLEDAYPRADGEPDEPEGDADILLGLMVSEDEPDPAPARAFASFLAPLAADTPPGAAALLAAGRHAWTEERLRQALAGATSSGFHPSGRGEGYSGQQGG
jgi:hypothetical protein